MIEKLVQPDRFAATDRLPLVVALAHVLSMRSGASRSFESVPAEVLPRHLGDLAAKTAFPTQDPQVSLRGLDLRPF